VSLVLIASPTYSIAEPAEDAYQKAMRLGTEAYAAKDFEKADERFRSASLRVSTLWATPSES
jgi:hypothetical protein